MKLMRTYLGMLNKKRQSKYNHSFKGRYRRLRASALARKKPLRITLKEYEQIVSPFKCFYCLSNEMGPGGYCLDRVNNSKGYTLNNVVPCCAQCNMLKGNILNHEEMIFVMKALELFRATAKKR